MLFSFLSQGDFRSILMNILLTIPIVLISLSFHEAAHGYIAYKMGDRTAFNLGRVTLNPAKHLDLWGTLSMLIFGYGWARPVPINARNFKNPKWGMALTAIAGPISNIILGIAGCIVFAIFMIIMQNTGVMVFASATSVYQVTENEMLFNICFMLLRFVDYFVFMNFVLAVFNLIPIPPFDGSRFFSTFLPAKWYFGIMKYERYALIIVIGISLLCSRLFYFSPFGWLAQQLQDVFYDLIYNLASGIIF